jgi:class 3 adenylate cyclase
MVGYTVSVERLSEQDTLRLTQLTYDTLAKAVREHGGTVRSFAGDSTMAVFGIPEALEDSALRACRAAGGSKPSFRRPQRHFRQNSLSGR